jgi:hypothetical protein
MPATHAPMLGNLSVLDAEDIARGETQLFAGRRDAEVGAAVGTGIDETRRDLVGSQNLHFDRHAQIGNTGDARRVEIDRPLLHGLRRRPRRRRRRGAHLMVDVIIRE